MSFYFGKWSCFSKYYCISGLQHLCFYSYFELIFWSVFKTGFVNKWVLTQKSVVKLSLALRKTSILLIHSDSKISITTITNKLKTTFWSQMTRILHVIGTKSVFKFIFKVITISRLYHKEIYVILTILTVFGLILCWEPLLAHLFTFFFLPLPFKKIGRYKNLKIERI